MLNLKGMGMPVSIIVRIGPRLFGKARNASLRTSCHEGSGSDRERAFDETWKDSKRQTYAATQERAGRQSVFAMAGPPLANNPCNPVMSLAIGILADDGGTLMADELHRRLSLLTEQVFSFRIKQSAILISRAFSNPMSGR